MKKYIYIKDVSNRISLREQKGEYDSPSLIEYKARDNCILRKSWSGEVVAESPSDAVKLIKRKYRIERESVKVRITELK